MEENKMKKQHKMNKTRLMGLLMATIMISVVFVPLSMGESKPIITKIAKNADTTRLIITKPMVVNDNILFGISLDSKQSALFLFSEKTGELTTVIDTKEALKTERDSEHDEKRMTGKPGSWGGCSPEVFGYQICIQILTHDGETYETHIWIYKDGELIAHYWFHDGGYDRLD